MAVAASVVFLLVIFPAALRAGSLAVCPSRSFARASTPLSTGCQPPAGRGEGSITINNFFIALQPGRWISKGDNESSHNCVEGNAGVGSVAARACGKSCSTFSLVRAIPTGLSLLLSVRRD